MGAWRAASEFVVLATQWSSLLKRWNIGSLTQLAAFRGCCPNVIRNRQPHMGGTVSLPALLFARASRRPLEIGRAEARSG